MSLAVRAILLVTLTIGLAAPAWTAPRLVSMESSTVSTRVGFPVTLTVVTQGGKCGVMIDLGDGQRLHPAVQGVLAFPITYATPGNYTVTAWGKKKAAKPKCMGSVAPLEIEVKPQLKAQQAPDGRPLKAKPVPPKAQQAPSQGLKLRPLRKGGQVPGSSKGGASQPNLPEVKLPPHEITSVSVRPFASFAEFTLGFSLSNAHVVEISAQAAGTNRYIKKQNVGNGSTLIVTGLLAGTNYSYTIVATKAGVKSSKQGNFKTKRREVTIKITEVHAKDDGDDTSAGDFYFTFLGGNKLIGGLYHPRMDFSHDIDTGTMVATNHSMKIPNVAESPFDVKGTMTESDSGFGNRGAGSMDHGPWRLSFDNIASETSSSASDASPRFSARGSFALP